MAKKIMVTVSDMEFGELLMAAGEFPLATWARVRLLEAARAENGQPEPTESHLVPPEEA